MFGAEVNTHQTSCRDTQQALDCSRRWWGDKYSWSKQSYLLMCTVTRSPIQWSFGVTCWEVFTGGQIPYGGISTAALLQFLHNGERLNKPINPACSDEM